MKLFELLVYDGLRQSGYFVVLGMLLESGHEGTEDLVCLGVCGLLFQGQHERFESQQQFTLCNEYLAGVIVDTERNILEAQQRSQ